MSERLFSSNDLAADSTTLGREAGKLHLYDGLETPFSEDIIELSQEHIAQIEAYAARAATNFMPQNQLPESTFAHHELGVPALVVRVDCTVVDGRIVAYEMEDSPSGQGVSDRVHRHIGGAGLRSVIRSHYEAAVGMVPHVIVSGARNHGTDDHLVVGDEKYTYSKEHTLSIPDDTLVIVKAIPGNHESSTPYMHLQERALAPLASEGDKTYQQRIGDLVAVEGVQDLLRQADGELESQVLKARIGSMAMGVSMYLSPSDRKTYGKKGIVTASRLEKNLDDYRDTRGGALVQSFAAPIRIENPEDRSNAIMRVFTLLENVSGTITARAIGGGYVARPELIVHGASNAVLGAVTIPEVA